MATNPTAQRTPQFPPWLQKMFTALMLASLVYQAVIAFLVARDFLAPGNWLMIGVITFLAVALLATIDLMVGRGELGLSLSHREGDLQVWAVVGVIMSVLLVVESGRMNVFFNPRMIADDNATQLERAAKPVSDAFAARQTALEKRVAACQSLGTAIGTAIAVEQQGSTRPDIEALLKKPDTACEENGAPIPFAFSGKAGYNRITIQLQSIATQKRQMLDGLRSELDEVTEAARTGKLNPNPTPLAVEASTIGTVRTRITTMRSTDLDPGQYKAFMDAHNSISNDVRALAAKYGVEVNLPPTMSLFTMSIVSVFQARVTSLVLLGLAFIFTLGPALFTLVARRRIMLAQQPAQVTPLVAAGGGAP